MVGNIYKMQIMNKFIIERMGQAWTACLNYLEDIKIMVLKGQVHTTTTIYGSNTTSTRHVETVVALQRVDT